MDHARVCSALMNTTAARRLGELRVAWPRQFREVFVAEWGSGSINGFAAEQASGIRED